MKKENKVNNLEFWNKVEKTNPNYTKKAKVGGLNITAIAPMYQIMMVTEQFGVYGQTWGFKNISLTYDLVEKFNMVVFKGTFFFPKGEFEIINSCKLFMDRKLTMIDDNFAKKIETDSLTKAISKLGFNADIFMGKFDDVRYLDEVKKEFAPKIELPSINDKRFDAALVAIENGEYTTKKLIEKYKLTEGQIGKISKMGLMDQTNLSEVDASEIENN